MSSAASECVCHHGNISRAESEQRLLSAADDGSFLLRSSETVPGVHILCLLNHGKVHKYRIAEDTDGTLFVEAQQGVERRKFENLNQLIQEYRQRGCNNGLACALQTAVRSCQPQEKGPVAPPVQPLPLRACIRDSAGPRAPPMGRRRSLQPISQYFMQRFTQLDLSNSDGSFIDALRKYAEEDVQEDAEQLSSGKQQTAPHLHKLIESFVDDFKREMEKFFSKIDICRELFGPLKTSAYSRQLSGLDTQQPEDFDAFIERLHLCRSAVLKLESKAAFTLKDLTSHLSEEQRRSLNEGFKSPQTPEFLSSRMPIPPTVFETRVVKCGKACGTATVSVHNQTGQIYIVKPDSNVLDASNVITADRIIQLVKIAHNHCTLELVLRGGLRETHVFRDARQRELFCKLLQQMKMSAGGAAQPDQLSVFIGTWNMGDAIPPWDMGRWLRSEGAGKAREPPLSLLPHDLYVVGTQETSVTEKEWVNFLKTNLRQQFDVEMHTVAVVTLWGIRLVLLVKPSLRNSISQVQQSSVKTGIANTLGNKGAVGVSLVFNATSICFVCAHLSARQERFIRRNQNFQDIMKGLMLAPKNRTTFDVVNQFHHLFFFGDLNYRVEDLDAVDVLQRVRDHDYSVLLSHDQLYKAQQAGHAFVGFSEEEIQFAPTYRFERGSGEVYAWQKFKKTGTRTNNPSWCDRVLWRTFPEVYISNTSYGSVSEICTSDHKPVFSTFDIGVASQYVSRECESPSEEADRSIVLQEITADIKTNGPKNLKIEFHSACLEEMVASGVSEILSEGDSRCCVRWGLSDLPQLRPIIDDCDYLEDQHIHLVVKAYDSLESYGDGVLSLKHMMHTRPQPFECQLMHQCEQTGTIRGVIYMKSKAGFVNQNRTRIKSYDLIYTDTDIRLSQPDETSDEAGVTDSCPSHLLPVPDPDNSAVTDHPTAITVMGDTGPGLDSGQTEDEDEDEDIYEDYDVRLKVEEPVDVDKLTTMQSSRSAQNASVSDWLGSLGLLQHHAQFIAQGWDHLDFVNIITNDDLVQLKVTDPGHRLAILDSIARMSDHLQL